MSWMPGAKPSGPPGEEAGAKGGKSALPPACPRCELMKGQFTKTIQNYQKAYRKKVEGLKTELKSSRAANTRLTKQVKQLKGLTRVHLPSLALGLAVGSLSMRLWRLLRRKQTSAADATAESVEAAPPAPGTPPSAEDDAPQHANHVAAPVVPQPQSVPAVVVPDRS